MDKPMKARPGSHAFRRPVHLGYYQKLGYVFPRNRSTRILLTRRNGEPIFICADDVRSVRAFTDRRYSQKVMTYVSERGMEFVVRETPEQIELAVRKAVSS